MARTKDNPRRNDADASNRPKPRIAAAARTKRRMRPGKSFLPFINMCIIYTVLPSSILLILHATPRHATLLPKTHIRRKSPKRNKNLSTFHRPPHPPPPLRPPRPRNPNEPHAPSLQVAGECHSRVAGSGGGAFGGIV